MPRGADTCYQSYSLMLGGQEHELTMRTAELIEDNALQALDLLVRYATSSRMLAFLHRIYLLTLCSCRRTKPAAPQLHHFLDA